ncbi:IclR family transcriptional regulator [Alkalicoccus chagannorensis]|uniref:IclR family transcriptional regulator n=1 Tax=Alkalicoccus chagannorensis TaxID=427072 RepID=UPI00040946FE|nr:IclR family transcriptional regulator [Alkalicoccus chagannorensis]
MRDVNMNPIRSVERAMDVLLSFSTDKPELSIEEITAATSIPKSTVYRLLCTLEKRSFVSFNEQTMKYKPGVQLFSLNALTPHILDVRAEAEDIMSDLHQKTGQTMIMAVPDGDEIIYVHKNERNTGLKFSSSIGQRRSFTYGVIGPSILAFQSNEDIDQALADPREPMTDKTELSKDVMLERLRQLREEYIYVETDETTLGVTGVGAPVFDVNGSPVAGIGCIGPTIYMEGQLEEIKEMVKTGAEHISKKMGFRFSYV